MTGVAKPAESTDRVAVVLAGAGARGAYEAGVMSVVLPRLAAHGIRPQLYVGTSAGAINAAVLAAHAHRPADEQVAALLEVWRTLTVGDVIRPLLVTAPVAALRYLGQQLRIPGVRLLGLLDTAPLWRTAREWVDWDQLRRNLDNGFTELAVVATEADGDRTVVFLDRSGDSRHPAVPPLDQVRGIEYRRTTVDVEHILASAAIPALFPAIPIRTGDHEGWYVDGGLRLNAPLKPAVKLGADRLVIVATHPATTPAPTAPVPRPDLDDALVAFVDVALVDRMVEDVRTLAVINEELAGGGRGDPARREVPHLFFGPERRGTLAELAADWFAAQWWDPAAWWRSLTRPDLRILGRLTQGDGARRGDLLSYLAFDGDFAERAITQGRRDAERLLGDPGSPLPWTTAPPSATAPAD